MIWKGSMPAVHISRTATQFQVSHISQDVFLFLRSFLNKLTSLSRTSWEIIWWNTSDHHIFLVTVTFTASLTIHAKLMCARAAHTGLVPVHFGGISVIVRRVSQEYCRDNFSYPKWALTHMPSMWGLRAFPPMTTYCENCPRF